MHDETGLTGLYDFTLTFAPGQGVNTNSFGPAQLPPADSGLPSLFTAVEEQLGLKLESRRGSVDAVVIDHIERPTAD